MQLATFHFLLQHSFYTFIQTVLTFCLVSQLAREAQAMKEQRDQQITELKTLAEQSGETAQHDFEKKVSTA